MTFITFVVKLEYALQFEEVRQPVAVFVVVSTLLAMVVYSAVKKYAHD